jgi:hypothetical protein
MTLGRWKSNAYQRHIKIPQQQLVSLSATIATPIPMSYLKQFIPLKNEQFPNLPEATAF